MKRKQQIICCILAVILLLIAAVCAYLLYDHQHQKAKERNTFRELASAVDEVKEAEVKHPNIPEKPQKEKENPLFAVYRDLAEQNSDMVGWIRIDDTTVNYPVMQTPDDFNFYLRRNFEKEYSNLGTPYIQENCDIETSDNLIIYGHHMLDGGMFSDLELYKDQEFMEKHRIIHFDKLDELGEYEVMAVIMTTAYYADSFKYYEYSGGSQEQFEKYVADCKRLSLYNTGVNAEYGDKLITLSTCEYSDDNGRLLVVAKKVKGEMR